MRKKIFSIAGIIIIFLFAKISAQTEFEGGIYENVTWTKENSPYIITGNVVVFPEKTLTVEPGVTITFTGDYYFEVRGKIIMDGLKDDTIRINSDYLPSLENGWTGININYPHAEFYVSYCRFDSLYHGISLSDYQSLDSMKLDGLRIAHCIFSHCTSGITGSKHWDTVQVDSCCFYKNLTGISSQGLSVTHSTFSDNGTGIFEPMMVDISNCEFYRNDTAVLLGSEGHITDCIFEENYLAVSLRDFAMTLVGNTIQNNHIGIRLSYFWIDLILPITGNRICNNIMYNVENRDKFNKSVLNNCWCLTDSAEIEAKIWDGYDDISVGLLNYDIYDDLCDMKLKSVLKIEISDPFVGFSEPSEDEDILQIHPVPAYDYVQIRVSDGNNLPGDLSLYTTDGKLVRQLVIHKSSELLDLQNLESGVYIIKIHLKNSISVSRIIIKE